MTDRPRPEKFTLLGEQNDVDLQPENKGADEFSEDSMASGSSGFGSLPRGKQRTSLVTGTATPATEEPPSLPPPVAITVNNPMMLTGSVTTSRLKTLVLGILHDRMTLV